MKFLHTAWLAFLLGANASAAERLGDIDFPTSGNAAAQPHFITGVKALHSFQFDEARIAFQAARAADPGFAMAYWGEAMSLNKPLWRIQETDEARALLAALGPTLEARQQRAAGDREKAWLAAIEQLYFGADDKLERDVAYSEALRQMHERWPDDHEITVFYALSILGTMRPGDTGFRRQARAAALCLDVFDKNPQHPGAAHFIIHSFDDPEHAVLALPAARVYAGIAPAAAHALHMPSHIFVQLGMWTEVVRSNRAAYAAAVAVNRRLNLPEGREDFHTLSWLAYGNLMLGEVDAAAANLALAGDALAHNPDNERVHDGYLMMRARHLLETGTAPSIDMSPPALRADRHASWLAARGTLAAANGDDDANEAYTRLVALAETATLAGETYEANRITVLYHQVAAAIHRARGSTAAAIAAARAALEAELKLGAPSGPPDPIKPSWELLGDLLLDAGQSQDAMAAYREALNWTARRTPSLLGLARAAHQGGDAEVARASYRAIATMPGLHPASAAAREAQARLD